MEIELTELKKNSQIEFRVICSPFPSCIGIRAVDKKSEVNIGDKAKSIKNKFETGELYKDEISHQHTEDVAVFEQGLIVKVLLIFIMFAIRLTHSLTHRLTLFSGLGKQSRSIFLEMDAKAATSPQLTPATPTPGTPRRQISQVSPIWPPPPKTQVYIFVNDWLPRNYFDCATNEK